MFLQIAVSMKWFSNWSLYYFNLIKPNIDKLKYSERSDCNSKLRNPNTAGNYQSTFVCTHLPPLGALLVLRDVDKLEWSLCMDFILTLGCIVLLVIRIVHMDKPIHWCAQSTVDLMKKWKELHCISQQTQKEYMLPTETERNYSWKQLTR